MRSRIIPATIPTFNCQYTRSLLWDKFDFIAPRAHLNTVDMSVHFDGGMWIWQSAELLASANEMADLLAASAAARIRDLYLYTPPGSYSDRKGQLQPFIANATAADIRVWALDGDRGCK